MKLARQSPQDTYTVLEAITTVFSQSPPLEVVTLRENTSGKTVKPPIDDEDDDEEIAHLAPAATRRSKQPNSIERRPLKNRPLSKHLPLGMMAPTFGANGKTWPDIPSRYCGRSCFRGQLLFSRK
jgi:hypothetical protein